MKVEAKFYRRLAEDNVECFICPHYCHVKKGESGICLVRKNENGVFYQTSYGEITSANMDPIEKKPLYHFYPGSEILSVGTNGCNLRCPFCQNYEISTKETYRKEITIDELLIMAKRYNSIGIAYTYNEPFVWYEFIYDCAKVFKENDMKNVIVSNGNVNHEPLMEIIPFLDGVNIDLKGFTADFYHWVNGDLETTKMTIRTLFENNVHTEVTFLLIPGRNDNVQVFRQMCSFLKSVSADIPLHISRYFPQYKSDEPVTNRELLKEFYNIGRSYLNYVYLGNVNIEGTSNSRCPACHNILIERENYTVKVHNKGSICNKCGTKLYFRF